MQLQQYIDPGWILVGLQPTDKPALLATLADAAADRWNSIDRTQLLERLTERELQSSTGIGNGVAVPHTFLDGLDRVVCLLAQVPGGLDYEAVDDQPVHFAVLLLGPADAVGSHLQMLARVARLVRRPEFVRELCAVTTAEEIHRLVLAEDERHAP